jgi:membrane protease YdiL (CAAX protease family)
VRFRSGALTGTLGGVLGAFGLFLLLGAAVPGAPAAARFGVAAVGLAMVAGAVRCVFVGLEVRADALVVRSFWWSRRLPIADVAGLAIEPVLRRKFARHVVVLADGEGTPVNFAAWRMATESLQDWTMRAAAGVGAATGGSPQVAELATRAGRLEHPAVFTALTVDGTLVAVPALTRAQGLTNATVEPANVTMLGRETVAIAVAFVLPATVTAIAIFARHVARVSNLDEFDLPLPHNLPASLVLMVLLYLATAVFTPIALLLLARTGQWPSRLGLSKRWLRRDALAGVGLLFGVWATTALITLPLAPLLGSDSLSNQQHNTHVPAYFIVYAIVVSATTAINEEVIVNGYLMTRFAQLGWRPWPSLWVSLALRTSYHAYYGIGLIATIPFGYWATRSFQKHRRLGRPIVAHFLNDAVLLTVAVLTS